jgi:hypothetical protein
VLLPLSVAAAGIIENTCGEGVAACSTAIVSCAIGSTAELQASPRASQSDAVKMMFQTDSSWLLRAAALLKAC